MGASCPTTRIQEGEFVGAGGTRHLVTSKRDFVSLYSPCSQGAATVRLLSYSEHSSCSELVDFVRFLKPKVVVPTVWSSEADRIRILRLFDDFVDRTAAKRKFMQLFAKAKTTKRAREPEVVEIDSDGEVEVVEKDYGREGAKLGPQSPGKRRRKTKTRTLLQMWS